MELEIPWTHILKKVQIQKAWTRATNFVSHVPEKGKNDTSHDMYYVVSTTSYIFLISRNFDFQDETNCPLVESKFPGIAFLQQQKMAIDNLTLNVLILCD